MNFEYAQILASMIDETMINDQWNYDIQLVMEAGQQDRSCYEFLVMYLCTNEWLGVIKILTGKSIFLSSMHMWCVNSPSHPA